jgi:GH35 family endo-1,4-beta-xylanase
MQLEGTYGNNVKRVQAMHDLIKKLRELKVEFQGIGLQGHFNVEDFPNVSAK